jgi:Cu2+-exporting ATPase
MSENSPSTIYLPLENVESEHCALIVDRGLGQVNGVTDHRVELNNRRAAIKVENKEVLKKLLRKSKIWDMVFLPSKVHFLSWV